MENMGKEHASYYSCLPKSHIQTHWEMKGWLIHVRTAESISKWGFLSKERIQGSNVHAKAQAGRFSSEEISCTLTQNGDLRLIHSAV